MLFYYKNKNVGSVTTSHTPTFIVEPFFLQRFDKKTGINFTNKRYNKTGSRENMCERCKRAGYTAADLPTGTYRKRNHEGIPREIGRLA